VCLNDYNSVWSSSQYKALPTPGAHVSVCISEINGSSFAIELENPQFRIAVIGNELHACNRNTRHAVPQAIFTLKKVFCKEQGVTRHLNKQKPFPSSRSQQTCNFPSFVQVAFRKCRARRVVLLLLGAQTNVVPSSVPISKHHIYLCPPFDPCAWIWQTLLYLLWSGAACNMSSPHRRTFILPCDKPWWSTTLSSGSNSSSSQHRIMIFCDNFILYINFLYLTLTLSRFLVFLSVYTQSVGFLELVIGPSQGLYINTGQHKHRINAHTHTHTPNIHALSGIRAHDHSVRASEDSSCFRPLGYRDRPIHYTKRNSLSSNLYPRFVPGSCPIQFVVRKPAILMCIFALSSPPIKILAQCLETSFSAFAQSKNCGDRETAVARERLWNNICL
jgi:hypothetical protein